MLAISLYCMLGLHSNIPSQTITSITATDQANVVPLLKENIEHNVRLFERVLTERTEESKSNISLTSDVLDWSNPLIISDKPDVIIISDCVYNPSIFDILLKTVESLSCETSTHNQQYPVTKETIASNRAPLVIMGFKSRGSNENHDLLWERIAEIFSFHRVFVSTNVQIFFLVNKKLV